MPSSKLLKSNSTTCFESLVDENSEKVGNQLRHCTKNNFNKYEMTTFVSSGNYNDEVSHLNIVKENMEVYSNFSSESSSNVTCDDNPSHNNTIALRETKYSNTRFPNGCELSNNNDGFMASSMETCLLPAHKYDNVSEVSHLSAASCETLLVSHYILEIKFCVFKIIFPSSRFLV